MARDVSQTVLIYRLGSLGDTVVALPCFHRIAQHFPDHRRIVLTNVPVSEKASALGMVLQGSGLIHGILNYPIGVRSPTSLIKLAWQLRATGADTLIYLSAPRGERTVQRDLLFFRLCGFTNIIGAPVREDLRANRIDPVTQDIEPEAERLARCIGPLGQIDLEDRGSWDLSLTSEELVKGERAVQLLGGQSVLAINVGGKSEQKDWGENNWRNLLAHLAGPLATYALVAVGAGADTERSSALLKVWPGKTANFCGLLTPRETAAVLRHADLFIGHDSGPMHLAAAMGVPTVGIFGKENKPRMWHPYGRLNFSVHDTHGVLAIVPEQVRDAALSAVRRQNDRPW